MGKPAALMLLSLLLASPAAAGTVYRCVGLDGVPNYTSKRVSNAVCKAIATSAGPSRVSGSSANRPVAKLAKPSPPTPATAESQPVAAGATRQVVFSTSNTAMVPAVAKSSAGARVLRGAVYRFERDGVIHYTNVRPRGAAQAKVLFSYVETCYACGLLPNVNFGSVRLNTSAYSNEIREAVSKFGVDEAIVRAIIHAESAYRPNALSHAGAQGLMQLIPATASRFGVSDPFDPGQNIRGGVQYLAWLMKRYSSNLTLVAAAYNAGEGAVDRNGGVPPYSETQRYVQRVGQLADRYRSELAGR